MSKAKTKRSSPLLSTVASVYAAASYLSKSKCPKKRWAYGILFASILLDPNNEWGKITEYLGSESYRLGIRRGD